MPIPPDFPTIWLDVNINPATARSERIPPSPASLSPPRFLKVLEAGGVEVETVILPDGEEFKSLEVLTKVLDKALSARLDRKCTFVALGGGVIGDMVGFAAAIYQRGVKFVQVR